jgi:hypothetical protein
MIGRLGLVSSLLRRRTRTGQQRLDGAGLRRGRCFFNYDLLDLTDDERDVVDSAGGERRFDSEALRQATLVAIDSLYRDGLDTERSTTEVKHKTEDMTVRAGLARRLSGDETEVIVE